MKPIRTRDYKSEKDSGQLELLQGLELVRQERDSNALDILQLAQIFAFCSLPYRPTTERQITHTARLGDGSSVEVIFTAMRPEIPIAYGNDRSLLYWLIDRAIAEETDFIQWEHVTDYIKAMKQYDSGRNRELTRERFRRIASTAITVVRKTAEGEDQAILPIVRKMSLPASIAGEDRGLSVVDRKKSRMEGKTFGLQFDKDFVKDFMAHRIPVLRSLLIATQARPQMQDCMFFLIWRSYSAGSQSVIKWADLRHQFWQADSNLARIRQRFKEAIALIRTAWPELEAEAMPLGLRIVPPKHGVQFIPQFQPPKHIAARERKKRVNATYQKLFPSS
jgi:hypothetical protein